MSVAPTSSGISAVPSHYLRDLYATRRWTFLDRSTIRPFPPIPTVHLQRHPTPTLMTPQPRVYPFGEMLV